VRLVFGRVARVRPEGRAASFHYCRAARTEPHQARPPGRRELTRRHCRIAVLLILGSSAGLVGCGSGNAFPTSGTASGTTAPAATQSLSAQPERSVSASAAPPLSPASSQAGVSNPVDQDALKKAWACGLAFGLKKLEKLGPDGKNLLNAIEVTLEGKDLAANRADLVKAAIEFGIDVGPPWLTCFEPYFFPNQAGAGAAPEAPAGLTVSPDPNNGTVLVLTWSYSSDNVLYFVVSNGVEERNVPASSSPGTVSYTWTGLKPGSWTCFRVRASNGDTASDWDPAAPPWYTCAYSSAAQPGPTNTATPAPVPTNQCLFLLPDNVDCASSNPEVTLEGENNGDTSGCMFSGQITWGDGSRQTVQYKGANGVPSFVARHAYQQHGTYSITLAPSVLSGGCTAFNGQYTFTYG
jgi:hypothetical protein